MNLDYGQWAWLVFFILFSLETWKLLETPNLAGERDRHAI